jgi:hypothetical protein
VNKKGGLNNHGCHMTSFMIADCSTKNCGLQPATITVPKIGTGIKQSEISIF